MVEAQDAADAVREVAESPGEARQRVADEAFRKRVALVIATLAMLLAISTLGGENATKEMINANIHASDTYSFYQAKNIRQTANQLAAEQLEATLSTQGAALTPAQREALQGQIERYKATVARYESEPATGEGKKELLAKAREWEGRRDHAALQDPNFDYGTALYQIAIVLSSVSIVLASRPMLYLALCLGFAATLLMVNGFFLLVPLPIG